MYPRAVLDSLINMVQLVSILFHVFLFQHVWFCFLSLLLGVICVREVCFVVKVIFSGTVGTELEWNLGRALHHQSHRCSGEHSSLHHRPCAQCRVWASGVKVCEATAALASVCICDGWSSPSSTFFCIPPFVGLFWSTHAVECSVNIHDIGQHVNVKAVPCAVKLGCYRGEREEEANSGTEQWKWKADSGKTEHAERLPGFLCVWVWTTVMR